MLKVQTTKQLLTNMQSRLKFKRLTEKEQYLLEQAGQQSIIQSIGNMNKKDLAETKPKFESAYFLTKNEAPLSLFPKLLSHEQRHGVILGNAYRNRNSQTEFIQYIAKSLGNHTKNQIENSNFYSLLTDGSIDSVTEKEAVFVMTFDTDPGRSGKV